MDKKYELIEDGYGWYFDLTRFVKEEETWKKNMN